jgi:hypothetical protein
VVLVQGVALDRAHRFGPREVQLAALKTSAATRLAAGQSELDLGLSGGVQPGTLPIMSSRMSHLWDALCTAYRVLGFESATKGDNVFRDLVLARSSSRPARSTGTSARGGRCRCGVVCHGQASPTRLRPTEMAAIASGRVRGPCWPGASQPGALRRLNAVMPTSA